MDSLTSLIAGHRLVGIVGPPGAGKSTLAEQFVAALPTAALLPMDGFHLPQARLVELGRRERMGAADTFDVDAFVTVLRAVRGGETVLAPGFDRTVEEAVPNALTIASTARPVIIEGNYLLHEADGWERVRPLLDVVLYVDVPRELRLERLIARHIRFGKTPEAARAWALGPDEANAVLIESTRSRADHVVRLA